MPHQDRGVLRTNEESIQDVLQRVLPERLASFPRHGNATLEASWLAAVAVVCWGWSTQGTLNDRVAMACAVVGRIRGVSTNVSRQGLMKALCTSGDAMVQIIVNHLIIMLSQLKGLWTRGGKVNVAVDGTKFKAPRTASNQQAFAVSTRTRNRRGKNYKNKAAATKATTVQLLMTVFWHLGTGLPLRWKVAGSTGSERKAVQEIVDELPANIRFIGDAEYVGYPLWSTIINSGRSFLFRVGSNITLLKNLGRYRWQEGYVSFWPDHIREKGQPPIVLRLFRIHNGKNPIFVVTNELDMTDELARELYLNRWGVEVFFRTIKQSCERSKLRCGQAQNLLTELDWTLLGIWVALFHGKETLKGLGTPPRRVSPVKVMRAFALIVQAIHLQGAHCPLLHTLLSEALIVDESQRKTSKKSRGYPYKKKHKSCGPPIRKNATRKQIQQALQHNC